MLTAPVLLDHSIVGQSQTTLTIRKDREFAACRICGDIFQCALAVNTSDAEWDADPTVFTLAVAIETTQWRQAHNKKHPEKLREQFHARRLTFTPEAAIRLAPFGLAPVADAISSDEVAQAMLEAPRAPVDDVQTTLKGWC